MRYQEGQRGKYTVYLLMSPDVVEAALMNHFWLLGDRKENNLTLILKC